MSDIVAEPTENNNKFIELGQDLLVLATPTQEIARMHH